jgi:hypothetical protein
MAQANDKAEQVNPVPHAGDHDRVAMLSLKADGTHDQHNPEIIGDKEFAVAATKRQFAEQSASAVDVAERSAATVAPEVVDDPSIVELRKKQDAAVKASESAAEKTVESLVKS